MNPEDILNAGSNPSDFWNKVVESAARDWHLSLCGVLQIHGDSIKLFGESEGGKLRSAPPDVRKAIMANASEAQSMEARGENWLVLPFHIAGSAERLILVVSRDTALTDTEQVYLGRFVEFAAAAFSAQLKAETAQSSLDEISQVVDLGLMIGESAHFGEAATRLCNELDSQLDAMRVTLGWRKKGIMELVATNHGGRVRNDTETAAAMARAMDEAAEQDCEVGIPAVGGAEINQQHRAFSQSHGNCKIYSLPLRKDGEVHGAVTVEYSAESEGMNQERMDALRVVLDLVSPQLVTLHDKSGWLGTRAWRSVRRCFASLLGYRHTGWKLVGLVLLLGFLLCCIIPMTHKVKAPFILSTEASADLTAPFAGYIDTVKVDVGEVVKAGQLLVTLDRRELVMQQSELQSERDKNLSEARKYEAEGDLSQMKLAQLAVDQADAKLKVVEFQLARTEIRAPFDGVIVEGDLKERLASPTQPGEKLLRIVQITDLYGELQVDERDIHFLRQGMEGQIAFTSRPDERFEIKLETYEPVALVKDTGTDFRVRVSVAGTPEGWWRPGMSGVCKIEIGQRSVAWVWLHRTWNFLRLKLWL